MESFFYIVKEQFMTKNIKLLHAEERPREKLMSKGASALTCAELIAILLRSGHANLNAIDLSREILLKAGNSLNILSTFTAQQLMRINGVGQAKALSILAAFELGRRMAVEIPEPMPQIHSSIQVNGIMSPIISNLPHEECWVLYLNRSNRLIGKERVSQSGISSTIFDIRIIVKKAVEHLATGIILVHNHPSGNPRPSGEDMRQTEALRDAAALFDISLTDHIIISKNKFYSFSDENL